MKSGFLFNLFGPRNLFSVESLNIFYYIRCSVFRTALTVPFLPDFFKGSQNKTSHSAQGSFEDTCRTGFETNCEASQI